MAEQFNPLDPLGIFGLIKKDVDRIATQALEFNEIVLRDLWKPLVPVTEPKLLPRSGGTDLRVEKNLLTTTEHEVLRLATEGLSNREIAERMGIAIGTVRVHLKDIRRRVGVATREEAVAAFGEPTERERMTWLAVRLPRPPVVTAAPYERRVAGLLPLVDELERNPSMETVGRLEDELHDLAEEVIEARALTYGIEATRFSDLHARLASTIEDVRVLVRAAIERMERGLIRDPWTDEIRPIRPMEKEAARRDFLSMIQDLRKNLMRGVSR